IGAKQEPSLTLTKLSPALESRRVRTQPRTVTSPPAGILPASACSTLETVMPSILGKGSDIGTHSLARHRPPKGLLPPPRAGSGASASISLPQTPTAPAADRPSSAAPR